MFDAMPNVYGEVGAVLYDLGRQPRSAHDFLVRYQDRVLFGSDWPVVTLASDYRRWYESLETITRDLSETAKRKLWSENAKRVYRLT